MPSIPARFGSRWRPAALGQDLGGSITLLAAVAFVTQVGVGIMLPLLPLYAIQLGATPTVLGHLTSVFALTNAGGQLLAGFLSERFAARRLIPAGLGTYAAANLLIAGASSALPLIAWRGLAGLGGGAALVSERLYLRRVVDQARLAFGNGVLSAAASAGQVAGPAIGGFVAAVSDLRVPFVLVGITSAIATLAALRLPRPAAGDRATAGTGATTVAERGSRRGAIALLLVANLALLAGFGVFITTYAPYATTNLGWSTAEVGAIFSLFGLGSITIGPWLGHQADRRGRRLVGALGTIPIGLFVVALIVDAPAVLLYPISILSGGGIAGFSASWFALLATETGGARGGRTFGTVSALSNLGIVIGAQVATRLWEAIDIRVGIATALVAVVVGGVSLASYPETREAPGEPAPA